MTKICLFLINGVTVKTLFFAKDYNEQDRLILIKDRKNSFQFRLKVQG